MYRAHTNAWRSKFDFAVKRSNVKVGHHFSNLVDLLSLMVCAKIQPKASSGEEDFKRFLPYMGMAAIMVNGPRPF